MFAPLLLLLGPSFQAPTVDPFTYRPIPERERMARQGFGINQVRLTAIRSRTATEVMTSWDDCGLPVKARARNAPLPPRVAGKKVREFLFDWPEQGFLLAAVPPGAQIVQVVQDRKTALVAAVFPNDAKVTSVQVGTPSLTQTRVGEVSYRPYDRFDPGLGEEDERFGHGLRWFAVPRPPENASLRAFMGSEEPIHLLGWIQRPGSPEAYMAVRAEDADRVRKVEVWASTPNWQTFDNVILDAAPPPTFRADAPVGEISLETGGTIQLLQIASKIPGLPYRAWTMDGGPPAGRPEESRWTSIQMFRGLELHFRTEVPYLPDAPPHIDYLLGKDLRAKQVAAIPPKEMLLYFEVPKNLERADLQVRYATGPWQMVAEEELRGQILQATVNPGTNAGFKEVIVRYSLPMSVRDLDREFTVFDTHGRPIRKSWQSSEAWPPGTTEGRATVTLMTDSVEKIARIRLRARPWRRTVLKNVPLHPRA